MEAMAGVEAEDTQVDIIQEDITVVVTVAGEDTIILTDRCNYYESYSGYTGYNGGYGTNYYYPSYGYSSYSQPYYGYSYYQQQTSCQNSQLVDYVNGAPRGYDAYGRPNRYPQPYLFYGQPKINSYSQQYYVYNNQLRKSTDMIIAMPLAVYYG
ncbi:unnamed protein product [Caenorhabditis auriculariae]|uniref:Uncharacterized protein n=1 Tax=Caenorhabditis auriculariae TaxID=2777116 RepID=A0A8S1HQY6_9PELO|nr:unnamed protein product [Caenorhabditis auriculariae]